MRAKREGRAIGSGPQKEITGWSLSMEELLIVGVELFVLGVGDIDDKPLAFSEGKAVVVVLEWLPTILPGILAARAAVSFAS